MQTAAIVAIAIAAAIIVVLLNNYIVRLKYEKRFREWRDAETIKWSAEMEQARKAAVTQSRAVLGGRFTEQMVPFFPGFKYDPTEVRFIGSPIDMIAFPGISRGEPEEIVILEIKTGNSQLTGAQKKIRQLIEEGMVRWDEIHRDVAGGE